MAKKKQVDCTDLPKKGDVFACETCGMELHCHVDCGGDDADCKLECHGKPLTKT